jgi:hypothetical protein
VSEAGWGGEVVDSVLERESLSWWLGLDTFERRWRLVIAHLVE